MSTVVNRACLFKYFLLLNRDYLDLYINLSNLLKRFTGLINKLDTVEKECEKVCVCLSVFVCVYVSEYVSVSMCIKR